MFSTVLLQLEVPDRFRGRVFAAELALVTLHVVGVELLDRLRSSISAGWSPRRLSFALGAMFCVPGVLWLVIESRWKDRRQLAVADAADPRR